MAHVLIQGQTECGKTTLAKHLAAACIRSGRRVLLYDPIGDPSFPCNWRTADADELARVSETVTDCALIIDEAGSAVDRFAQESRLKLLTRSRHMGHFAVVICQRNTQVSPLARDMTSRLYLFRTGLGNAKQMQEEFAAPGLADLATNLKPYQCVMVDRFGRKELREVKPFVLSSEGRDADDSPVGDTAGSCSNRAGLSDEGGETPEEDEGQSQ